MGSVPFWTGARVRVGGHGKSLGTHSSRPQASYAQRFGYRFPPDDGGFEGVDMKNEQIDVQKFLEQ